MSRQVKKSSPVGGHVPPQNIEMEEAVLGCILLESKAIHQVLEIIQEDTFYVPIHTLIWSAIIQLVTKSLPVDQLTVLKVLKSSGENALYISEVLTKLTNRVVDSTNIGTYARIIEEKAIARRTIMVNSRTIQRLYEDSEDLNEILVDADTELFKAKRSLISAKNPRSSHIGELALQAITDARNGMGIVGVPFGIPRLDDMTGGMRPGRIYTIGARSRIGKTAVAAYSAYYAACNGSPSVFFSMEMGQVEFYYRLVSLRCRELGVFIPYTKIDRGRLDDNEMNTVTQAIEDLKQLPILIDDTPGLTPLIFKSKLLKYINDDGVQSAWLDYIQIGNNEGKGGKTTADQISGSMTEYKNVTKDLNIPIGILSQIDKNVENNGQNGRPLFVNLKGSGSLGEASDVVILLHRPEVYDPEPVNEEGVSEKGVMYIDVVKNKMGDMGLIKELFSVSTNYLEKENPWVQSSPAVVVGNAINHYGRVKQDYNIDDDVPF